MLKGINPEIIWLGMGIILVLLEFVVPGLIIIFFGAGAIVTCITTWTGLTESLLSQVLTFCLSSTAFLFIFRWLLKKIKTNRREEVTNFNIEIGRLVDVIEMIEPGKPGGKVRYQGADWSARCDQTAVPGDVVRVTGCDNLTLIVEIDKNEGEDE